ncbi:MAG: ABC transporter permease [Candidatus Omnitrophota bacterium]|nr:ABC transporter permease [Candidatus Omnitrophota bacterium]
MLRDLFSYLGNLVKERRIIFELAKRDFRVRYLGSYLGILWAFLQPAVFVFLLWFIFHLGFRSAPVKNMPYILWLLPALIPWFFFSESLSSATNALIDNSHIVKKVVFQVNILPVIKIVSSLYVHLVFVGILFVVYAASGRFSLPVFIHVAYYLSATILLVLGLSFFTASLVVFIRDVTQVIAILLNFGFWMTPIFWHVDLLPEKYQSLMRLNPVYYITEGYRNSFMQHAPTAAEPLWTLYFWAVVLITFVTGAMFFKRLKPHFADVL